MTARVLHFDAAAHNVADALLPWLVNGTLEGDELAFVQRHLGQCGRCQREVEWLRELHAACIALEADPDAPNAPRELRRRLDEPRTRRASATSLRARWSRVEAPLRWAMAIQLAIIVALGAWLLPIADGPATYRTLGARNGKAPSTGNLVVVFDPTTTEAELRRILRDAGARIVDGPTQANAYVLDVPALREDQAMQALRGERAAILVEQLGPRSAP